MKTRIIGTGLLLALWAGAEAWRCGLINPFPIPENGAPPPAVTDSLTVHRDSLAGSLLNAGINLPGGQ